MSAPEGNSDGQEQAVETATNVPTPKDIAAAVQSLTSEDDAADGQQDDAEAQDETSGDDEGDGTGDGGEAGEFSPEFAEFMGNFAGNSQAEKFDAIQEKFEYWRSFARKNERQYRESASKLEAVEGELTRLKALVEASAKLGVKVSDIEAVHGDNADAIVAVIESAIAISQSKTPKVPNIPNVNGEPTVKADPYSALAQDVFSKAQGK